MKKTMKSVQKWKRGQQLSAGDNRRLDELVTNIKAGILTVAVVILLLVLLRGCGML